MNRTDDLTGGRNGIVRSTKAYVRATKLSVWKKAGIAALTAGLAAEGCTVGPDYKAPQTPVPSQFSEAATRPSTRPTPQTAIPPTPEQLREWWTTFRDPELDRLVSRALSNNLDLQAAVQRVRQERALVGVAQAGLFPTINTVGSYTHSRRSGGLISSVGQSGSTGSGTGNGAGAGSTGTGSTGTGSTGTGAGAGSTGTTVVSGGGSRLESDIYQVGFDSSWELDVFGGIRRDVEATTGDLQAAVEDRRSVLVTLLGEVATTYVQLRGLQRQVAITKGNIDIQQQSLGLIETKNRAGLIPDLDVTRQRAQVETTESQLPALTAQIHQAIHRLSVLMGEDPGTLEAELEPQGPIPFGPSHVPPGIPSELLRRRPDIRRAERRLAAATARIGVATADLFPKFSLTGSLGLESNKFKSLFNYSSRFFSIGPSVSWPIFDAGRIRSNIEVQNALEREAFITYEQSVLTGLQEVDDDLIAYATEQDRRAYLAEAVKSDQRAVELTQDLYKNGLGDFLNVLTAQQSLFSAQDALTISEAQVSTNLVALYKALGGGWEASPE